MSGGIEKIGDIRRKLNYVTNGKSKCRNYEDR
jgi:hypothetical protein